MPDRVPEPNGIEVPFFGRRAELKALAGALAEGQPILVTGAAGIGKSRLIREALAAAGRRFIAVERPAALHDLLADLSGRLACRPASGRTTSMALKPAIAEALQRQPLCLLVEGPAPGDARTYRFLQELSYIPGAGLVVASRGTEALGHLRKLLWDPRRRFELGPLPRRESLALFKAAARACALHSGALDEFGAQVLAAAHGNPGQIVAMCRLAGRPEYRSGGHIRFFPLRIDALAASLR